MVTDIPSADQIRQKIDIALLDKETQAEWWESLIQSLAGFLDMNTQCLLSGQVVEYVYPTEDRSGTDPIFARRYPEILQLLREKGYWCDTKKIYNILRIQISLVIPPIEGIPLPRQNASHYVINKDYKPDPWWKIW